MYKNHYFLAFTYNLFWSWLGNSQPLQVASVYTLYRNIEREKFVPDIIIFDEAHHIAASTWLKIVKRYKDATKVGVTATPIRLDNKPLGKFFNVLISDVQTSDLVSKGYLCNHKVFAGAKQPDLTGCRLKRGEYQKKDLKKEWIVTGKPCDYISNLLKLDH